MPEESPNLQAPRDTDAKKLHKAMLDSTSGDGVYARNLHTLAGEIGWTPDRLSVAMQELVAQDLVLPMHEDGRADRVANSRWLVLDAEAGHPVEKFTDTDAEAPVTEFDEMTVAQLREFADANSIDLGEATKKAEIRAAIDTFLGADPNAQAEVEA